MTRIAQRLLIVSQGIDGGIAPLCSALARDLCKNGWQTSVMYVGRPGPAPSLENDRLAGIDSGILVTGKARTMREVAGLLKAVVLLSLRVRQEKPDAVILAGFMSALLFTMPFKLLGVPLIVFWNHGPQNTFVHIKKLFFPLVRWGIDATVCISASTAASFTKQLGFCSQKISIIPNGVDPRRWQNIPSASGFETLRVLMPLRCDLNQKDPVTLVKAVAQLRRCGVDIELTLVGSGIDADVIQAAIQAEGQGTALRLLPATPDISTLMTQHNVVCLSTRFEGLPTVVIEGMLARRVVIASRVEGCIDVIRDNENGFLFDPGSVDDCAAKLDALRTRPDLPAIILQAYDDASTVYAPSSMAEKFTALLSRSACGSRT